MKLQMEAILLAEAILLMFASGSLASHDAL